MVQGTIHPVNVLNNGESMPATFGTFYGEFSDGPNVTNAISTNGSRIFWTGNGNLYVRENGTNTVQVDESQGPAVGGGGEFLSASSDGSHVLFLDRPGLTNSTPAEGGKDLYDYNVENGELNNLTPASGASVIGFVGASENASYVYFVAEGALQSEATAGEPNLYLWRKDQPIKFIATLSSSDQFGREMSSWNPTLANRLARVSPEGRYVTFYSTKSLAGYNNAVAPGHVCLQTRQPDCAEVYEYDAQTGRLTCASCDATGAQPVGDTLLPAVLRSASAEDGVYQQRYLLDDGRLFFDTPNALVPQDTNGVEDVYEFEPEGVGSCGKATGCVNLISTGTSPYPSEFADASEAGNDVFFTTRQQLVPEDKGELVDLYDARVGGGFPVESSSVPCSGEECHGAPEAQGAVEAPSSTTFSGLGNAPVQPAAPTHSPTPKSLTRAQKLAKALKACKGKIEKKRVRCESQARRRYGATKKKTKARMTLTVRTRR